MQSVVCFSLQYIGYLQIYCSEASMIDIFNIQSFWKKIVTSAERIECRGASVDDQDISQLEMRGKAQRIADSPPGPAVNILQQLKLEYNFQYAGWPKIGTIFVRLNLIKY